MYECCPCFCTNSRSSRHFCYITRLRFRTFNISQHISQSLLPLNKAKKTSKTGKPASGHKLLKVIWALKLQEQRGPAGAAPVSSWQALEWLSVKSRRALNFHQQPSHWKKFEKCCHFGGGLSISITYGRLLSLTHSGFTIKESVAEEFYLIIRLTTPISI